MLLCTRRVAGGRHGPDVGGADGPGGLPPPRRPRQCRLHRHHHRHPGHRLQGHGQALPALLQEQHSLHQEQSTFLPEPEPGPVLLLLQWTSPPRPAAGYQQYSYILSQLSLPSPSSLSPGQCVVIIYHQPSTSQVFRKKHICRIIKTTLRVTINTTQISIVPTLSILRQHSNSLQEMEERSNGPKLFCVLKVDSEKCNIKKCFGMTIKNHHHNLCCAHHKVPA